jgi:hypothetical protein
MWQIMCGYLIVGKIVGKTRFSCNWYMDGFLDYTRFGFELVSPKKI